MEKGRRRPARVGCGQPAGRSGGSPAGLRGALDHPPRPHLGRGTGLEPHRQRLGGATPTAPPPPPLLVEALAQLAAYFNGTRSTFDLPLAHGRKGLQADVLEALRAIPQGENAHLWRSVQEPSARPRRPIGQACGANPLPIPDPCHRVLSSTGLGGFSAPGGVRGQGLAPAA